MPRQRLEVSFPVLWALLVVSAAQLRGAVKTGGVRGAGHHARSGACGEAGIVYMCCMFSNHYACGPPLQLIEAGNISVIRAPSTGPGTRRYPRSVSRDHDCANAL